MSLFRVAVAWFGGVIVAALGPGWLALAVGGGAVAASLTHARRPGMLATALLVLIAAAGFWCYEASRPDATPGGIALYNGATVTLEGFVVEEPEQLARTQRLRLRVETYEAESGEGGGAGGLVLVTLPSYPRLRYGDSLTLRGKLEEPPRFEDFDYRAYLARKGVVSLMLFPELLDREIGGGSVSMRLLTDLRRSLSDSLSRALGEPEAALAQGILLGQRSAIPQDVSDEFNRGGVSHLVAISGYNLMLVAGFTLAALSSLIGRRPATVVAMVLVLVYAGFVGGSGSVLRAAVMAQVMLGASYFGRPGSALGAVALAGALLTLVRPQLIHDVSFQLSFAATLGIVILNAPLQARLRFLGPWAETAAVTLAASIAVLPIIVAVFGRVSLVALPANLVAVPIFGFVLASSAIVAVCGAVWLETGRVAAEVGRLPLEALIWWADLAARLPVLSIDTGSRGTALAAAAYGAMYAIYRWKGGRRRVSSDDVAEPRPLRLQPALVLALLFLVAAGGVWWRILAPADRMLTVSVLNVGQGDAILIETPSGQRVLVDGGPSGAVLDRQLNEVLDDRTGRIDLVVLTHGQDDHVSGLVDVMERRDIGAVLAGPLAGATGANIAWREAVQSQSVTEYRAETGAALDLGGGVRIDVLGPPFGGVGGGGDDLNDNSVVLRLVYGDVSFLLTGDLAAAGEQALLRSGFDLQATVLKVGHHGSETSTTPAFLRAVAPSLAVISAGADNTFGHPAPGLRLRLAHVPLLRTDENGRVELRTDGRRLWAGSERGRARIAADEVKSR